MLCQPPIGGRLLGEDVERRAGQTAVVEGGEQRLLVDHAAAGAVDQERPPLHARDALGREQPARLVGHRHVQGDNVGRGQQPSKMSIGSGVLTADEVGVEEGIVGHDLHVEKNVARARRATCWPMRPNPMTPRVLPWTSAPTHFLRFHCSGFDVAVGR